MLAPADDNTANFLSRQKDSDQLSISLFRERNAKHHRKIMGMLNKAYEACNQDEYPTFQCFYDHVKIRAGWFEPREDVFSGDILKCPRSLNFNETDERQMVDLHERIVKVLLEEILVGKPKETINEILGDKNG